jgi:hypothetical protein
VNTYPAVAVEEAVGLNERFFNLTILLAILYELTPIRVSVIDNDNLATNFRGADELIKNILNFYRTILF